MPQGTDAAALDLPAALSARFDDGSEGEVAVTWQCTAGYDPSAAGASFAFEAVLPEGYALAEGAALPQILVTLTPPPANSMLMAKASSGEGWEISDDGVLTVTGEIYSIDSVIAGQWDSIKSIVVEEEAYLELRNTFSGTITVKGGHLASYLNDDLSAATIIVNGNGNFDNYGTISGSTSVTVNSGNFSNIGTISGGKITGTVYNAGSITGGDFTGATVNNMEGGTVTGGTFDNFKLENDVLTITGNVDLSNGGTLAPLTVGLDEITSIVVDTDGTFDAGEETVSCSVENKGTITGGTFSHDLTNYGTITGGDFTYAAVMNQGGTVTGGTFRNFKLENGELTINGNVDLSTGDALDPLTIDVTDDSITSITVEFNAGSNTITADVTNNGKITGGTFSGKVTNNGIIGDYQNALVTLNGEIDNNTENAEINQPCTFGENAKVTNNAGRIQVSVTADGALFTVLCFGDNILENLGHPASGAWYRVSGDTYTRVGENDTFGLHSQEYRLLDAVLPAPDVEIDYVDEQLVLTLPEGLAEALPEGVTVDKLSLRVESGSNSASFGPGLEDTYALSDIGDALRTTLPAKANGSDAELSLTFEYEGMADGDVVASAAELTVPARPDKPGYFVDRKAYPYPYETSIFVNAQYELGLLAEDDSGNKPNIFTEREEAEDGQVVYRFTTLTAGATCTVYMRYAATQTSFCSDWQFQSNGLPVNDYTYYDVAAAVPVMQWTEGMKLTEAWVSGNAVFINVKTGDEKTYSSSFYDIVSVTDEQGQAVTLPITKPGKYTVKVEFTEINDNVKAMALKKDTFSFEVTDQPAAASDATIDYFEETLSIALPEGVESSDALSLTFTYEGKPYKPGATPFADGSVYTIALSTLGDELGTELPATGGVSQVREIGYSITDAEGNVSSGTVSIPGRREGRTLAQGEASAKVTATTYVFTSDSFEAGLKPSSAGG